MGEGRHIRVVDRMIVHGDPIDFRELCRRVLTDDTRYLVLDMDRTVHLGRNVGELLGWELGAWQSYGEEALDRLEPVRERSRFVFDRTQPAAMVRYLASGARRWAYPGLFYLLWGKMAYRTDWLRRRAFRRFGPDPVRRVQRVPQLALMAHLEEASLPVLRSLTARILARHEPDQVIDREDLAWVRDRFPRVRIVLASASPRPAVEEAAAQLGIETFSYSTPDRINSGEEKVARLRELCPDIFEPGVVSVGITDTGYGEDHCWADHFTRVVDINSDAPFPPIVASASPCREVHSARVLTRAERAERAKGRRGFLDPRRSGAALLGRGLELDAEQLRGRLADVLEQIDALLEGLVPDPRVAAHALLELRETARGLARA